MHDAVSRSKDRRIDFCFNGSRVHAVRTFDPNLLCQFVKVVELLQELWVLAIAGHKHFLEGFEVLVLEILYNGLPRALVFLKLVDELFCRDAVDNSCH